MLLPAQGGSAKGLVHDTALGYDDTTNLVIPPAWAVAEAHGIPRYVVEESPVISKSGKRGACGIQMEAPTLQLKFEMLAAHRAGRPEHHEQQGDPEAPPAEEGEPPTHQSEEPEATAASGAEASATDGDHDAEVGDEATKGEAATHEQRELGEHRLPEPSFLPEGQADLTASCGPRELGAMAPSFPRVVDAFRFSAPDDAEAVTAAGDRMVVEMREQHAKSWRASTSSRSRPRFATCQPTWSSGRGGLRSATSTTARSGPSGITVERRTGVECSTPSTSSDCMPSRAPAVSAGCSRSSPKASASSSNSSPRTTSTTK